MSVAGPIGIRIRQRRKALGITQSALAQDAGISASYLNLIEADKRAIGGTLLRRIAERLDVSVDTLAGTEERRLIERLSEVAATPNIQAYGIEPETANSLVSRHPDWARAMLGLWRSYRDGEQYIAALTDRIDQDPTLSEAVHHILNNATAIRSTSEVLDTVDDLTGDERSRFVDIILSNSGELSRQAELLIHLFESGSVERGSRTPAEDVDDLYIQNRAWFPEVEQAAEDLRRLLATRSASDEEALSDLLQQRFGIGIHTVLPGTVDETGFRNAARFDASERHLQLLSTAPPATRRFQMARIAVELALPDCVEEILTSDVLTTDEARSRARSALRSSVAAALLLPYDMFLEDAVTTRYDIEALAQRYGASLEQVCVRLITLKKPGAEGIPFGLMRTDPAGFISKRYPLPGLPLPRGGSGCPLWPLYGAFQTPERTVRQLAEFPNGARFLFIARTVRHEPAAFHAAPFLNSIMLACDVAYADRTVYADGMDLGARLTATKVGPACRLCPRQDCQHRGEPSALTKRNVWMTP
ncbi:helix-turn-helix domain-containing protein [Minwuia sp.]|uniref:helix-turn-helix domain-containing protein n=1 Tax=Minwuia sp. TaxID=2493630 RepID=UPI003A8EA1BC